jgi:hypothetical protein
MAMRERASEPIHPARLVEKVRRTAPGDAISLRDSPTASPFIPPSRAFAGRGLAGMITCPFQTGKEPGILNACRQAGRCRISLQISKMIDVI